ncbi:MAG: dihydroorotase [Nitrospiraceae bacterium]|nr:dihydroorotase [Nitrospiraceae bacterium]
MRILITGGRVIDPSQEFAGRADILMEDGLIKTFARDKKLKGEDLSGQDRIIDAGGMWVIPGLIDMHTHLREPGYENKETIRTGSLAALHGGFTTVCAMPNTNPVNDNPGVTEFILKKARAEGNARVLPIGAVTKGQTGEELAPFYMMREAGCVAFSDDGRPVANPIIMRRALEYARGLDALIISHAEDPLLSDGGVMNEGLLSVTMGLKGSPSIAEEVMIYRDIALSELTGGRVHIAHVSTMGGVRVIRQAKERGVNVTAETCPHYFSLTEEAVSGFNTHARVNPPLRTHKDVEAIKEGLKDGTIDIIATDHAPHSRAEKISRQFDDAPPGISGLETALPLSLALVELGVLSEMELIRKLTQNPAKALRIDGGTLREGMSAELAIVDPQRRCVVEAGENFISLGKNTPFDGMELKGAVIKTIFREKVMEWQRA